jgi:KAP family P-loop domain
LSLAGLIWKGWDKLGEKAAGTVRELIREPDYEGKMGYLHLVESDIREVLDLVTAAQVAREESGPTGAEAPGHLATADAALKRRSSTRAPLVVFVDDLDRCAPNKVAEVVEAINLFLCGDYPNCIFVLGMEPGMVAAALEVANKDVIEKALEMGLMDRSAPVGWRFMEKIVQLPITIPPPTKRGRDSYVESLVGSSQVGSFKAGSSEPVAPVEAAAPKEEEVREFIQQMQGKSLAEVEQKSLKVVAEAPTEKKRAAAEAGKRVYANTFSERDPAIAEFVQDVAELVDGNPRQIKRYVNVFRFYSTLRYGLRADGIVAASDFPTDKVLAKFVALNIQWPHAVDCLRVKKILGAKGEAISRLQYLEEESARIAGEACDEEWKTAVDKSGAGSFAAASAFREFLKKGESLGKSLGQGLW